ncbi:MULTISPECIES: flagellar hook-length control protein FliK [Clostridium]|uniref:flagellar hook-length control protein FliK n=1 Tax=Clostridium TaxID=1485 RepID=UPI000825D1A4|nr:MULTISPECIES: flagellar hook-length control protein FliK [Clostridium]
MVNVVKSIDLKTNLSQSKSNTVKDSSKSSFDQVLKSNYSGENNVKSKEDDDSTYEKDDSSSGKLKDDSLKSDGNVNVGNESASDTGNVNAGHESASDTGNVKDDKLCKLVDDLKKLVKDDDKNSSLDLQGILQLISGFLGNSGGNIDINKLKDYAAKLGLSENVQNDISKFVSDIKDLFNGNSTDKVLDFINSSLKNISNLNSNDHNELISNIVSVLKQKVNKGEDKSANVVNHLNEGQYDYDESLTTNTQNTNLNVINQEKPLNNENASKNSNDLLSSSDKKDDGESAGDSFLKNLVNNGDKSDSKYLKVTTLMNQISHNSVQVDGAEEVPNINKSTFAADIVKSVKYMQNNNIQELTVKINPKELGEVLIRLTMDKGVMKADIVASNKDAYALLNANLKDINSSLNNENIKIQTFSVNVYNEDTTFFGGQGASYQNGGNDKNDSNNGNRSKNLNRDINEESSQNVSNENEINKVNVFV